MASMMQALAAVVDYLDEVEGAESMASKGKRMSSYHFSPAPKRHQPRLPLRERERLVTLILPFMASLSLHDKPAAAAVIQ